MQGVGRTLNHTPELPIRNSAIFVWPPRPRAALARLFGRWIGLTSGTLFLLSALLVWNYLQPPMDSMQSLVPGWILMIWLRNLGVMLLFAGSLHLWLFIWHREGARLKYDARPLLRGNATFTFCDQLRNNMFWTLASGVTFWTLFEVLYFWGIANGVFPTFVLAGNWHWLALWIGAADLYLGAFLLGSSAFALAAALSPGPCAPSSIGQYWPLVRLGDASNRKRALPLCTTDPHDHPVTSGDFLAAHVPQGDRPGIFTDRIRGGADR